MLLGSKALEVAQDVMAVQTVNVVVVSESVYAQGMDKVVYLEVPRILHDELQRTSEGNRVPMIVAKVPCLMYDSVVYVGQIRYAGTSVMQEKDGDSKDLPLLGIEEEDTFMEQAD